MKVNQFHFDVLCDTYRDQVAAESWKGATASEYSNYCTPRPTLLTAGWDIALKRDELRKLCLSQSQDPTALYVAVMAWGRQNRRYLARSWHHRSKFVHRLLLLRSERLTRCEAFGLFHNDHIDGLGPSYFTKLLFFFSLAGDCWIMDQWTSKSINLLFGNIVPMQGHYFSPSIEAGHYEQYCAAVDEISSLLSCDGERAEMLLFSRGGRKPHAWRAHVMRETTKAIGGLETPYRRQRSST